MIVMLLKRNGSLMKATVFETVGRSFRRPKKSRRKTQNRGREEERKRKNGGNEETRTAEIIRGE